jgi:hypothetical protein
MAVNSGDSRYTAESSEATVLVEYLDCPIQHGLAQVDKRHVEMGKKPKELKGVVACAAADIEKMSSLGIHGRRGLGYQVEKKRGIDNRDLSRIEAGKPLHVFVEPFPNLVNSALHFPYR